MKGKIFKIKNMEDELVLPVTTTEAVYSEDGKTLNDEIDNINSSLENIENEKATRQEVDVERKRIDDINSSLETIETEKMNKDTVDISVKQINKNKGLLDETYFTDEFKAQFVENTQPLHTVPANNSINQSKMVSPYLEGKNISKNLFNKFTIREGYYADYTNGNEIVSINFAVSEFIPVKANVTYVMSGTQEQYCLYDSSKVFIKGFINNVPNATVTPTVDGYIKINMRKTNKDAVMFEVGKVPSQYEDFYKITLDMNSIKEPIDASKLDQRLLKGVESSNLFNKATAIDGYYIRQEDGTMQVLSSYCASDWIEVKQGITYCISLNNGGTQGALYNSNKEYIKGITFGSITKIFTPTVDGFFRFGFPKAEKDLQKVEIGNTPTKYEPYGVNFISKDMFLNETIEFLKGNSFKIVSKKENSDFTNINDGVSASANGDIILIDGGTYNETVRANGKDISLIGVDKTKCILKTTTGDYTAPPLEMNIGYLANMTIIAEKIGSETPQKITYCVHIDDMSSTGKSMLVENCDFISDWNACVGIGLWGNYTLTFKNCTFYKRLDEHGKTNGAVFFHNGEINANGQKIIFDNCRIKSVGDVALCINDVSFGKESLCEATFYNTIVYSETTGKECVNLMNGALTTGKIQLTNDSFGNNVQILNK